MTATRIIMVDGVAVEVPDADRAQKAEIAQLEQLAAHIGYGRCIQILQRGWSRMLQRQYGMPHLAADRGAGIVCPWCDMDSRTGKKA